MFENGVLKTLLTNSLPIIQLDTEMYDFVNVASFIMERKMNRTDFTVEITLPE